MRWDNRTFAKLCCERVVFAIGVLVRVWEQRLGAVVVPAGWERNARTSHSTKESVFAEGGMAGGISQRFHVVLEELLLLEMLGKVLESDRSESNNACVEAVECEEEVSDTRR